MTRLFRSVPQPFPAGNGTRGRVDSEPIPGGPGPSGPGSDVSSSDDAVGVCQSRLISSAHRCSSGTFWKTSFSDTVIGMARTRPTRPHRKPQNRQAISTVVPFMSSDRPMMYGVTT